MTEELEQFKLPETWQEMPLNQAFRFTRKPKEVRYAECETIPFIPMELIPQGGKTQTAFVLRKPEDISSGSYFERGDVLLAKITPSFENGKQGIAADIPGVFGVASTEAIAMQSIPGQSCKHYLFYYLLKRDVRATIARRMEGSTGRQRVPESVVANWLMPVPPLAEQKNISSVLHKIQQAVEVEGELARKMRELKKATLSELFAAGLRGDSQKITQFGEVPEAWEIMPLSSCAYVQTGATKGREIPDADALEVPYLRVANVQDGHLDLSEMKTIRIRKSELDGLLLRRDDVVLTEGGDFDKLGRGFIWEGQIEQCVHQNHIFAVRVNREKLLPRYFAYLAQSPYGRAYFLSVAHKTTNLACINTTKLRSFPVLIPQLDEQEEIAEILGTLDRKIAVHDAKQRAWQDLFKTMLHKLMTAQIRVNDLDIDTRELEA